MGLLSRFLKTEVKQTPLPTSGGVGKRLVVGNWKSHKTPDEARSWLDVFASGYTASPDLEIVIAPTMLCLESVACHLQELQLAGVSLAAQDVSPFPCGGYTGAVAADMLKGFAEYVIVGHSDRRRYFHESVVDVTNKVTEVIESGLRAIVCVDRPYAVSQLSSLADLDTSRTIVAYSPVDALSFRIPESPENVCEAAEAIANVFPGRAIIYGGSLTAENAGEYLCLEGLAGIFVGSASLDPQSFLSICRQAAEIAGHR